MPAMPPTVSPEHEQARRAQILDAAERCFVRHGYAATRIADIATEAGIGKGTVYEYWRSKEALLADTCLHTCARSEGRMAELMGGGAADASLGTVDLTRIAAAADLHPVAAAHHVLRAVLEVLLSKSHEEPQLFSELATVAIGHPELLSAVREQLQAKYASWIGQAHALYLAGNRAGYFRDLAAAEDCSRLIVAAVDGLVWQRLWLAEESADDAARRMADAWLRLLLVEPQRLEEYLR